jgi:antirestriction protein ArdC
MSTRYDELCEQVTAEVVRMIEEGSAGKWRMPWEAIAEAGQPVNATTHAAYRGGNVLWLSMVAASHGWGGDWATYKQWAEVGAQVRKGEKATFAVKWLTLQEGDAEDGGRFEPTESGADKRSTRMVPKVFALFNAAQVDGWIKPETEQRNSGERIAECERWFSSLPAVVEHGGNSASYSPAADRIRLPLFDQFASPIDYYATRAHESAHWTGHASRLNRDLTGRFGTDAYAAEELVAELSAAFTCARLGISSTPRPDHASYLESWLRVLRSDARALFSVASKAQAASDFLADLAGASVGELVAA